MTTKLCVDCGQPLPAGHPYSRHIEWAECQEALRGLAAKAEAKLTRLAELEEAARWRPVSEPPQENGEYQVKSYWPRRKHYSNDYNTWRNGRWVAGSYGPPAYWRPIPPLPSDAQPPEAS